MARHDQTTDRGPMKRKPELPLRDLEEEVEHEARERRTHGSGPRERDVEHEGPGESERADLLH